MNKLLRFNSFKINENIINNNNNCILINNFSQIKNLCVNNKWNLCTSEDIFNKYVELGYVIYVLTCGLDKFLVLKNKNSIKIFDENDNDVEAYETLKKCNCEFLFKPLKESVDPVYTGAQLVFYSDSYVCYRIWEIDSYTGLCTDARSAVFSKNGKTLFNEWIKKYTLYVFMSVVPIYDPKSLIHILVDSNGNIYAEDIERHQIELLGYFNLCGVRDYYSRLISYKPKTL